jgi:hypothetical protein
MFKPLMTLSLVGQRRWQVDSSIDEQQGAVRLKQHFLSVAFRRNSQLPLRQDAYNR